MSKELLRNLIFVSNILTVIFSFSLGIYSIRRRYNDIVIRLWFFLCIAVSVWCASYIFIMISPGKGIANLFLRVVYSVASLIPILYFHFISSFLLKNYKNKKTIFLGYFLALTLLFLSIFSNLIVIGAKYLDGFGYTQNTNKNGLVLFIIYFLFYIFLSFRLLILEYFISIGYKKRQIFFILTASLLGFVGGMSNFIFDLLGIYPFGQIIVFVFPILITYGIFIKKD